MLSVISVLTVRAWSKNGAGESARVASLMIEDVVDFNGAPQISHSAREGWFTKVQRGHDTEPPFRAEVPG